LGFVAELAVLFDLARAHPGVAVDLFVGTEAWLLSLLRTPDASADCGGAFFGSRAGDIAVFDGGNPRCQSVSAQKRKETRKNFDPVPKILEPNVLVDDVLVVDVVRLWVAMWRTT
jgi:hypothetical protein